MKSESSPSPEEYKHPQPLITEIRHPSTREVLKQEVRLDDAGNPREIFLFNKQSEILAYVDTKTINSIGLDQAATDMLLSLTDKPEKKKGIGPLNL